MITNTTEAGLEALILRAMTGRTDVLSPTYKATETSTPVADGTGWILGDASHYDRDFAVDLVRFRGFLFATQESLVEALGLNAEGPTRQKFLARLQGESTKRGVIDVLREVLFLLGRCIGYFAVDDQEVRFCTELKGKASWFLPFNRGYNDGAGNPPNSAGLKTV